MAIDGGVGAVGDQPDVGFVDERGGLEGVVGPFVAQERGGETMQLVVNLIEQFPIQDHGENGDIPRYCHCTRVGGRLEKWGRCYINDCG